MSINPIDVKDILNVQAILAAVDPTDTDQSNLISALVNWKNGTTPTVHTVNTPEPTTKASKTKAPADEPEPAF